MLWRSSVDEGRGLTEGLFLNKSFRANDPDEPFVVANFTLIFDRDGVESDRSECREALDTVRLRGTTLGAGTCDGAEIAGALSAALSMGEGNPGLDSKSPIDV